jgi:hypothetical protein
VTRFAGAFYLLNIVTILLAIFFIRGIVVAQDPATAAANVITHQVSFRLGSTLEVVSTAVPSRSPFCSTSCSSR